MYQVKQYMFMEKINSTLDHIRDCVTPDYIPTLLFGLLFSIECYQRLYKISHNDLHDENIFVEYIDENTKYQDKRVIDADYFEYILDGQSYYLPPIPFLIKLADFGLACKYQEPWICPQDIVDDGMEGTIPNWFSPIYDAAYSTYTIEKLVPGFAGKVFQEIMDSKEKPGKIADEYFDEEYDRFILSKLDKFQKFSLKNIIVKMFAKYKTKPTDGSTILLGRL